MNKDLSQYKTQLADKYIEFLKDLEQQNAPVFEMFQGKPSAEKRETLVNVIKFFSVMNKRLAKIGIECDTYDILSEILSEISNNRYKMIFEKSGDSDTIDMIEKASNLVSKIANFIYQGYIVEKDDHSLAMAQLEMPDIDLSNMRKAVEQNLQKMPEAIICKNGKVYPARDMHELLVQFLIANNVDLRNAVRIDAIEIGYNLNGNPRDGRIMFSSLDQFAYMWRELERDKTIWLTKEQADSMYKFFLAVKQCYPNLRCSFKDVLMASENLGWQTEGTARSSLSYYKNQATRDNLELLGDIVISSHEKSGRNHNDLGILNIYEDLINQNTIRRSEIINKKSSKCDESKGTAYSCDN